MGRLCQIFAEITYPQEGQAVLKHAGWARQRDVLPMDAVIGVVLSI